MKSIKLVLASCLFFLFTNCKHEAKSGNTPVATVNQTDTTHATAEAFVCPMHPDVQGKAGDKCSKCAMVLVSQKSLPKDEHAGHNH